MSESVPQLHRKLLAVNPGRKRTEHFAFNSNLGYKSKAEPSVISWSRRSRGTQGESVNSGVNGPKGTAR